MTKNQEIKMILMGIGCIVVIATIIIYGIPWIKKAWLTYKQSRSTPTRPAVTPTSTPRANIWAKLYIVGLVIIGLIVLALIILGGWGVYKFCWFVADEIKKIKIAFENSEDSWWNIIPIWVWWSIGLFIVVGLVWKNWENIKKLFSRSSSTPPAPPPGTPPPPPTPSSIDWGKLWAKWKPRLITVAIAVGIWFSFPYIKQWWSNTSRVNNTNVSSGPTPLDFPELKFNEDNSIKKGEWRKFLITSSNNPKNYYFTYYDDGPYEYKFQKMEDTTRTWTVISKRNSYGKIVDELTHDSYATMPNQYGMVGWCRIKVNKDIKMLPELK